MHCVESFFIFFAQQHGTDVSVCVVSVRLSVCHTAVLCQNDASHKDSSFRTCKASLEIWKESPRLSVLTDRGVKKIGDFGLVTCFIVAHIWHQNWRHCKIIHC